MIEGLGAEQVRQAAIRHIGAEDGEPVMAIGGKIRRCDGRHGRFDFQPDALQTADPPFQA
jgi:hypothetical protein